MSSFWCGPVVFIRFVAIQIIRRVFYKYDIGFEVAVFKHGFAANFKFGLIATAEPTAVVDHGNHEAGFVRHVWCAAMPESKVANEDAAFFGVAA